MKPTGQAFPCLQCCCCIPPLSEGLPASLRLLEPPPIIWVVPGNSLCLRSEPKVGKLWWIQWSTTNLSSLMLSVLDESKAQALASFQTQGGAMRCRQFGCQTCPRAASWLQTGKAFRRVAILQQKKMWCCDMETNIPQKKRCCLQCFFSFFFFLFFSFSSQTANDCLFLNTLLKLLLF